MTPRYYVNTRTSFVHFVMDAGTEMIIATYYTKAEAEDRAKWENARHNPETNTTHFKGWYAFAPVP